MKRIINSAILICMVLMANAQTYDINYSSAKEIGKITSTVINEASGIAASYKTPDAFWVHNDSGDGPNIYLIDKGGQLLTRGALTGADSRDWEDIASFSINDKSYLLIANTGDNGTNRSEYMLYIIEEPEYNSEQTSGNSYPILRTIKYQYDNGSQDCESVAVDVNEGKIILISKSGSNQGERFVYEIPLSVEAGTVTTTAVKIGQIVMDGTTAMDISNDGQRAIVITYDDGYEFTRFEGNTWNDAFATQPRMVAMPSRGGGEAIGYGTNGVDLYLVREGGSSPVWKLLGTQEQGTVFKVDMFEVSDLYEEKVWLNIPSTGNLYPMSDTDNNNIYACVVDLNLNNTYTYYYSYQNGSDANTDIIMEQLPQKCSNIDGYREISIEKQNTRLKPYIFGQCYERPYYITLKVDVSSVPNRYENGAVWVNLYENDTPFEMTDNDGDGIYEYTLPVLKGSALEYKFSYQNGANATTDIETEQVPSNCASNNGYRTYLPKEETVELLAVVFGTCNEALPEGTDITDLPGTKIKGSNDNYSWISATEGSGSPDGQEVDKLIDNSDNSKYLVRAIQSWVEIVSPNLSKVHAYTITSGGDIPSRDPRSWDFQGWNNEIGEWENIHSVDGNPEWQDRNQRKSWHFDNEKWYGKYRLNIREINGNPQQLMQMTELQIFGEVGEALQWSDNALLKELSVVGIELTPAFDPNIFDYSIELSNQSFKVDIKATPDYQYAQVEGAGSFLIISLPEVLKVVVTAEDGINTNTYTISYTMVDDETGMSEKKVKFRIYPIPANDRLYIENPSVGALHYDIYNVNGQLVLSGESSNNNISVDLSPLQDGIYFIKIQSNEAIGIYKIVR